MVKNCYKCGIILLKSNFHKDKTKNGGLHPQCKLGRKKYYVDKKDRSLNKQKLYTRENRDQIIDYQKTYNEENRDQIVKYRKIYIEQNRVKIKIYEKNRRKTLN